MHVQCSLAWPGKTGSEIMIVRAHLSSIYFASMVLPKVTGKFSSNCGFALVIVDLIALHFHHSGFVPPTFIQEKLGWNRSILILCKIHYYHVMQVKHVHRLSLHSPPLSRETLRDRFSALRDRFSALRDQFLALRDQFWPGNIDFWPRQKIIGVARSIFGFARSFSALRDRFLALPNRFWPCDIDF